MSYLLIPIYNKNMEYVNAIIEDSDHEGHIANYDCINYCFYSKYETY